jgi:hypothetical protein
MFKTVLPLMAAACLYPTLSRAQLTVLANGNVGIGTAAPVQKLDVILNAADPAQEAGRFANNSTTASTKYGLRNTVSNAGTGTRYGILNDVQQLSTSSAYSYGISNNVTAGTSGGYGIYNTTNSGGGGFRYGILNQVIQTSASGNMALGLYNYTTNTVGYTYGIYNYNYTSGASTWTNYGMLNYQFSYGTSTNYGIYNYVSAQSSTVAGNRYGIWTEVQDIGTGLRYGIYSRTPGAANYAGFFEGNVHVQGNFTTGPSDDKLKVNVKPLTHALDIIQELDPKTYDFRTDVKGVRLPEGAQMGLMASQVEKVVPMLVKEINTPVAMEIPATTNVEKGQDPGTIPPSNQKEEMYSYKTVNYLGMVPLLIQAIKDQQQMIDKLQQQLQEQKAVISRLQPAGK